MLVGGAPGTCISSLWCSKSDLCAEDPIKVSFHCNNQESLFSTETKPNILCLQWKSLWSSAPPVFRITELFETEGTPKGHLVALPCTEQGHPSGAQSPVLGCLQGQGTTSLGISCGSPCFPSIK